jgi:FlaA1/EpsC-like NDP-sugar epimerase
MEIARKVLQFDPRRVCLFSNDENGLFEAQTILGEDRRVEYRLGDVRDGTAVESALEGSDVVFHAAALKHVTYCELNPYEAVYTNVLGTQIAIDRAIKARVSKFVYVSTDKAVNPVGTMGATKLLGERLTVAASRRNTETKLLCVRFGNVLGSRGSVLRIFETQVRLGKPMTITDPEMTRFFILTSEAAGLVLDAAELSNPGETFVLKMPAVKIGVLAEASRDFLAERFSKDPATIEMRVTGPKPGEKMHEELLTVAETLRTREQGKFYVIARDPPPSGLLDRRPPVLVSSSAPLLAKVDVIRILELLERENRMTEESVL